MEPDPRERVPVDGAVAVGYSEASAVTSICSLAWTPEYRRTST
jgi:hypothetical protein